MPYFFLLLLLISVGLSIGRGISNTLFLNRYGIDYLPVVFLIQGVTLSLCSLVYASVADRHSPQRVMMAMLGATVVGVLVLWLAAQAGAPDIVWGAVYLLYQTVSEILTMHATLYIGATFYGEQAKRLVPIATAGSPVGEMLGGIALVLLAPRLGSDFIVLLWPLFIGLALVLILLRHRSEVGRFRAAPRSRPWAQTLRQLHQGAQFLRRSPLLAYTSLAMLFALIGLFISAYLFKGTFARAFSDADKLAETYGLIILVSGASAFLLQSGLMPALIRRFGLRAMNLVFPLTLLSALLALLTPWALTAAAAAAYNRYVLLAAVRNPVRALMLQALPDTMQGRARALALVIMIPLGMICSGLILYFLQVSTTAITLVGIGTALLCLWYSWRANRAYGLALLDTLRERHFVAPESFSGWNQRGDNRLADELLRQLQTEDLSSVENAARVLLAHFPTIAIEPILNRLSTLPVPLRDRLAHAAAPRLEAHQRDILYATLLAGDIHSQASALTIGLRHGWPLPWDRISPAVSQSHSRLIACRKVAMLTDNPDPDALQSLREDLMRGDIALRRAILTVLRFAPNPAALPLLLESLKAAHTPDATSSLLDAIAAQQQILPADLAADLAHLLPVTFDAAGQATLLAVITRLPEAEQFPLLLRLLNTPHPKVGAGATAALCVKNLESYRHLIERSLEDGSLGPRGQECALNILATQSDSSAMRAFAECYAQQAAEYTRISQRLVAVVDPAGELLQTALNERALDLRRLGFVALGHGHLQDLARTLYAALDSTDLRLRARCNEAIALVADKSTRLVLHALFSSQTANMAQQAEPSLASAITKLRNGKDVWLASCAAQWSY
ncbi:MAG: MFS transporter [Sulfuritalea sp.]|nr:MFS transporter [Sulfuritalea sp.]